MNGAEILKLPEALERLAFQGPNPHFIINAEGCEDLGTDILPAGNLQYLVGVQEGFWGAGGGVQPWLDRRGYARLIYHAGNVAASAGCVTVACGRL